MNIGILGPKGTFSEVAFLQYKKENPQAKAIYFQTLEETTKSLQTLDKIIVPLENTLEGYVQQMIDFLISNEVYIEQELFVYVQFALVYKKQPSDIKNIYVQFAAKGQCQQYIETLNQINLTLTHSNTQSYKLYHEGSLEDAAIVPTHLVSSLDHHLNVTDSKQNYTRFMVISKQQSIYQNKSLKVSLVVIPTIDRPGLLYDILSVFKKAHINLTSIMSRPQKNMMGKYFFFIEFDANNHVYDEIDSLIQTTKDAYTIKILGIYPKQ